MTIEKRVEIPTPDGVPQAILYQAEDGGRRPGVLQLTDIGGIRPAQQAMARRLAEEGYTVLMPNTARGGGISRKITSAQDRSRLKEVVQDLDVPEGMGIILRTAGAAVSLRPETRRAGMPCARHIATISAEPIWQSNHPESSTQSVGAAGSSSS